MAVLFTDAFTRANETPLAGNWTTQGGGFGAFNLSSNDVSGASGSNNAVYVNSVTPPNDQYAQCTNIAAAVSLTGGGPCVRMSTSANTMYGINMFVGSPTTVAIFYFAAGTYNSLATANVTHTPGDTYRIEVSGSSLSAYQNGVVISGLSGITDTNLTSGRFGLYQFAGLPGTALDDFEGGSIAAAGGFFGRPYYEQIGRSNV